MDHPMQPDSIQFTSEEWQTFRKQFGELKHTLNNALAVFMALAELARRNPDNFEKLARNVIERTPNIIEAMGQFTLLMDEKGKLDSPL